jgi:dipeptidase E
MRNILLVSSSRVHGSGYLDHCESSVRELFTGISTVLFLPYALHDLEAYSGQVRDRFRHFGFELESIHRSPDPEEAIARAEGIFLGGGNTFRLLRALWDNELVPALRRRIAQGLPYMGASAGSNVAGPSIKTTNDMPIVLPPTFESLRLVPFQVNPHYLDPDPDSRHMGESRDTRLREFHEEDETPVVALREGALLRIEGSRVRLDGAPGGKLFRRDREPVELADLDSLDFLLQTEDD